jgi:hypothetical protein
MSRGAIAMVGAALVVGSCMVGGVLPAVLKPGPPWYDVAAQPTPGVAWRLAVRRGRAARVGRLVDAGDGVHRPESRKASAPMIH